MYKTLVINPGSTSTKIGVFEDGVEKWKSSIEHTKEELAPFKELFDQFEFRKGTVINELNSHGESLESFEIIMSRGGLLPPVKSGAYEINDDMVNVLHYHPQNVHASNIGAAIAQFLASEIGIKAYIYDPVTVDELTDINRITGLPMLNRKGMGHNLNMRAQAIRYAEENNLDYKGINVVVAHLGGGVTLSLHEQGRISDMISDDEGPFSPERAGGLPIFQVFDLVLYNEYSKKEAMELVQRNGGFKAHLNTKDIREVEKMIENGDEHAKLIYDAFALNVGKNIAKLSVSVCGNVDAIILTGGIAQSKKLTDKIKEFVSFISDVVVYPGERELEAMASGALRLLKGEESARVFVNPYKNIEVKYAKK